MLSLIANGSVCRKPANTVLLELVILLALMLLLLPLSCPSTPLKPDNLSNSIGVVLRLCAPLQSAPTSAPPSLIPLTFPLGCDAWSAETRAVLKGMLLMLWAAGRFGDGQPSDSEDVASLQSDDPCPPAAPDAAVAAVCTASVYLVKASQKFSGDARQSRTSCAGAVR